MSLILAVLWLVLNVYLTYKISYSKLENEQ